MPRQLKPSARSRIVEAARGVFARTPYERVRVLDLQQAAGVSRATFYRLFLNKEEVWHEVSDPHGPPPRTVHNRLLEGCREAFGQLGFEGARVEDITRAAGVSKPTFYSVFTSKEQAYEEVDAIAVRYLLTAIVRTHSAEGDWRHVLDKTLDSYLDWRVSVVRLGAGRGRGTEAAGLRVVRQELLEADDADALLHGSLLVALDFIAASWPPNPAEGELARRKALMRTLLFRGLGREDCPADP